MIDKAEPLSDHFSQLQEQVIDPGLCNYCGTCVAVCPEDCIEMPWPNLVPTLVPGRECATSCDLCIKVCPGKEILYDELSLKLFGRPPRIEDEYFGACREYYFGHAADPIVWQRAAGGGIASALAIWLLETGEVDGVILCGMSEDAPWKTVGKLVRTREEVLANAGTRYSIVPTNATLREVREAKERYVLVGAGCHISGFRKMVDVDSEREWAKKVPFTIGIMCGGNVTPMATLHLISEMGIEDLSQIKEFRHRGVGGTGAEAILKNGEKVQLKQHFGFQHQRMLLFHKAEGCLFCMDNVSELADLTVGDYDNRSEGVLYVRSERGATLVQKAIEAGILEAKEIDYVTTLKGGSTFAYVKACGGSEEKVEELEAVIPEERTLGNRGNCRLYTLLKERRQRGLPVTSYGGREQLLQNVWDKRKISPLTRLVWWAMKQPLLISLAKRLPPAAQFELQKLNMGYRLGEPFHGAGEEAQRRIKVLGWEQFVEEAKKSRSPRL